MPLFVNNGGNDESSMHCPARGRREQHRWLGGNARRRNAVTAALRGNSLQRKLAIATAVGGLCTLVLAALVIAHSFGTFMAARQNLHDISAYRGVLDAANVLSAERGPANSVLGEPPLADSAARARLRAMRALSDAALQRLAAPPAPPFGLHGHHLPALMVERVRERLQRARAEIDQLAARPLAERDMDAIRQAIESMFDVVDLLQPAIAWQVRELSACHEGLAAAALTGKMLGDLREYGGRIASQIMAPVAARQPMPVQSLVDATRSRGRLLELWQLAGPAYNMFGDSPALGHAYADTNHQFFGQGMAMIDSLVAQGRVSGHYSMTPEELTNRYVRTLEPLERLRRLFLDEVVAHFAAMRAQALRELAAACGATALILAVLGYILVFAQRSVFLPLLRARRSDRPGRGARPSGLCRAACNGHAHDHARNGDAAPVRCHRYPAPQAARARLADGAAGAPGAHRQPHRATEPARAGAGGGPLPGAAQCQPGADRRRSLQADQRPPWPCGRRRSVARGGDADARAGPPGQRAGPLRRRGRGADGLSAPAEFRSAGPAIEAG